MSNKRMNNEISEILYRPVYMLQSFMKLESAGGMILVLCALAAMIVANSPWHQAYHDSLHNTYGTINFGAVGVA